MGEGACRYKKHRNQPCSVKLRSTVRQSRIVTWHWVRRFLTATPSDPTAWLYPHAIFLTGLPVAVLFAEIAATTRPAGAVKAVHRRRLNEEKGQAIADTYIDGDTRRYSALCDALVRANLRPVASRWRGHVSQKGGTATHGDLRWTEQHPV